MSHKPKKTWVEAKRHGELKSPERTRSKQSGFNSFHKPKQQHPNNIQTTSNSLVLKSHGGYLFIHFRACNIRHPAKIIHKSYMNLNKIMKNNPLLENLRRLQILACHCARTKFCMKSKDSWPSWKGPCGGRRRWNFDTKVSMERNKKAEFYGMFESKIGFVVEFSCCWSMFT